MSEYLREQAFKTLPSDPVDAGAWRQRYHDLALRLLELANLASIRAMRETGLGPVRPKALRLSLDFFRKDIQGTLDRLERLEKSLAELMEGVEK